MKRVLIAYDGSSPAQRALVHATELVRPDDEVTVINVMPEPGISSRLEPPKGLEQQRSVLNEAERLLEVHGIEARTIASTGDVAAEVLAAAQRVAADVIVVARRHGHVPHVLGSISGRIVRGAGCDVLVVHEGPAEGVPGAVGNEA